MDIRALFVVVFLAGMSTGWLGKTWFGFYQSQPGVVLTDNTQLRISGLGNTSSSGAEISNSASSEASDARLAIQNSSDFFQREEQQNIADAYGANIIAAFKKLLNERRYNDAMILYQEQNQENEVLATQLRRVLLERLGVLSESRNSGDFSELIESYLSNYYEDIDVLLLLADFNKSLGSYFEVVDVFLLAKTYAYSEADQKTVQVRFNSFVKEIDDFYTNQKNWLALVSFYSYIDTSGLMTSLFQYQQALAHLRSGDQYFAIEQFRLLLNDSLVGESAAIALDKLTDNDTETIASIGSPELQSTEGIPLQKLGNQFAVNLTVNRQDDIKLLIDTGASMTTLSRAKFDSLISSGEAVIEDRRVFRTASGVVMGTVYSVSEVRLGQYSLENTKIAVLDFDISRNFDGLLGMNILGQFRFQIDQENTKLLLSK